MNLFHWIALALPAGSPSDTIVPSIEEQFARTSGHYRIVLEELRAADTSRLTEGGRAARRVLLDALEAYRVRADFGRAAADGARVPWFVDAEGRRCAVAELLHVTGEDALVERVRATANHAWILDLAGDAQFARWLAAHGLAFEEAARIQTPVIDKDLRGQADSARSPGPTPSPEPDGPTAPPPTAPGSTPARANTSSSTLAMATSDEDGWWLWWEHAKLEFLLPNRPGAVGGPITGAYAPAGIRDAIESARRKEFPRFVAATRAPESTIRGAAATALGACGGRDAVEPLLPLLGDPSQDVRHRAILALGATGSSTAASHLLRIARDGALEGAKERVSPYARQLAIVALALARRAGLDAPIEATVCSLVKDRAQDAGEAEGIALAAMFHHVIAPAPALEELARELSFADHESPAVRCRATEALGSARDPETLAKLQTHLSGPRLDLRRSAALALGATKETSVQPALMTAFELEAEPLTRGFVLVAVGRLGGAKAHAFLARILREGRAGDRRWAAIALGVLARETRDPETSILLRATLEREKHAAGRAAYWLACGLVRDEGSIEVLARELRTASDPRLRMYAATALALVGGPKCAEVLRARLAEETSAMARVAIAQALGILGEPADARAMRGAIEHLAEPALQGIAATALALHGSLGALAELRDLARSESGPRVRRAATLESLGLVLARGEPFSLSLVSRRANYTVMPDWAQAMFQTTL